ncbi:hypothetical protein D9611_008124 [Ephemerocybe angulata]|uniref:VPS9 domain-containing protein n=1 Tax=Ephemerocybe angulata TaxID=980116 RepID=A0A8H5BZ15_9AGAR|nr:hypothetical protein D9611_008124 [Tulosesus angulatus]
MSEADAHEAPFLDATTMSTQRDRQFPATSIGRSAGTRVVQQPAIPDNTHPLLSPGAGGALSPDSANGAPKYLPYTPRQRVVAAATTTGTIVHPPPSPQHQGNATTKLQLMHLKAAAQNLGLDTSTIGWAILEKLVAFNEGEEWQEIWNLITSGKATLLLPLEQHSNEKLTPDFIRDHIIVWDGSMVVTSSGLRAVLDGDTVTLRSTISPTSKVFQDLFSPISRSTAFSLLPPLPDIPESSSYPRLVLSSDCTTLPLPPAVNKPALPPRPTGRSASGASTASRIPNPFASLFGSNSKATSPSAIPTSPPASIRSFDSSQDTSNPIDVTAFTIDRKIVRYDVAKEINKGLKHEIKGLLASSSGPKDAFPMPGWVLDRVLDFTVDWFPFVRVKAKQDQERSGYVVNTLEESSDDAADRVQEFLMLLDQDLRAAGTPFVHRHSRGSESDADVEKERDRREQEGLQVETRVREVLELVERIICSLFYERLFMQSTTDDASHDEALTSRIAALNMLDLTLAHLDVLVGDNGPDVEVVVNACGEMLSQLDPCRCPGDKASILVAAHKVVVDGLSRLSPIRLKSEGEDEEIQTARPANSQSQHLPPPPVVGNTELPPSYSTSPEQQPSSQERVPSPLLMATTNLPETEQDAAVEVATPSPPHSAESEKKKPPALTLEASSKQTKEPTPVSGDILLPMLIFSVVKANPPRLLSNLLYTQRFRNHNVGGEESYCLINLMAVAEFLENVDLDALGLGDTTKVLSAADLTPIPLARSPVTSETPLAPGESGPGLRGRVEQQVDAIADSANKVISGVVDSSFGILRSFLPNQGTSVAGTSHAGGSRPPTPAALSDGGGGALSSSWKSPKPGFGLLRRESGFSLASLAANLPMTGRSRSNTANTEELGQQLITVSRPGSVRSRSRPGSRASSLKIRVGGESSEEDGEEGAYESESVTTTTDDDEEGGDGEGSDGDDGEESGDDEEDGTQSVAGNDARSIKSFESMLASSGTREKKKKKKRTESGGRLPSAAPIPIPTTSTSITRKSLSDRLARVSNLASSVKGSPQNSRSNSLLLQPPSGHQSRRTGESPASSRSPSPILSPPPPLRLAPPIQKFVDCNPGDLRLSEIGELLRDYRRLVEGVRAVDGFDE